MSFKIVRNDITKMNTEAIVNTANSFVKVGPGCDRAIYTAAGFYELAEYRRKEIGEVAEGEVFITPGFNLKAKYIIHAVSPLYSDGNSKEEEKLRSCYKKSLALAKEKNIKSIAFPLIATGSFGYPREEGMRVAVDEINAFLLENDMDIYLVVFDTKSTLLGEKLYPDLEAYIDHNYVKEKREEEYGDAYYGSVRPGDRGYDNYRREYRELDDRRFRRFAESDALIPVGAANHSMDVDETVGFSESHQGDLDNEIAHLHDTFSEYLLYLIKKKNMTNVEVYKRALVDKKLFSKIKTNPNYHPDKVTVMCLCVGAMLSMDDAIDLMTRAGYAFSPCDKMDIIFRYFIEHNVYDMIEIDIQLEEHGLPCIIK